MTFRKIFVHNMFSLCSAKRRASDKNLPLCLYFNSFKNVLICIFGKSLYQTIGSFFILEAYNNQILE